MKPLRLLLAGCLLSLGCAVELELPPGAQLSCEVDADCPGELVCNEASKRCGSRGDTESPGLAGEPVLSDDRLTLTEPLGLSFAVTEALETDPVVTIDLGGRLAPLTLQEDGTDRAALSYAFRYRPDGEEAQGRTAFLSIDLVDEAGNAARGLSGGAVTFDFTDPAVGFASVGYTPSDENPIGVVKLATVGTELIVILVAEELLDTGSAPTLQAALGDDEIPLTLIEGSFSSAGASFAGTVPAGLADGDYALTVTWADLAGNLASVPVADVPIRIKATDPALTIAQELVTFIRSPWGSTAPITVGGIEVDRGPYFALAPGDPFSSAAELALEAFAIDGGEVPNRIQIWVDEAKTTTLGQVFPTATGWPRKQLAGFDTPRIFVTAIDQAGNESDPQLVENVEWVATLAPPIAGNNPNRLTSVPFAQAAAPAGDAGVDVSGRGEVMGADSQRLHQAADFAWHARSRLGPGPRVAPAVAFDSRRGTVVLFGGSDRRWGGNSYADTWEWDGTAWREVTPVTGSPSPRTLGRMVYDSHRGRMVLFGGEEGSSPLGDTWEWDGSQWHEVQQGPAAGPTPDPRSGHAMAFDRARGVVVLYGGLFATGENRGDTWEYSAGHWGDVSPAESPSNPSNRSGHSLAFDPASGRTLLVGGLFAFATEDEQATYSWDGVAWVRAATDTAPRISDGELGIDPASGRIVLWGGFDWLTVTSANRLWQWDGARWSELVPTSSARPPGRAGFGIGTDHLRGRLVVTCGERRETEEAFGDVWEWDGARWLRSMATDRVWPKPREQHALGIDPVTELPIMFGGRVEVGAMGYDCLVEGEQETLNVLQSYCLLGSTWAWDGGAWRYLALGSGASPSARSQHAMTRFRDRLVLFGGFDASAWADGSDYNAETWEWDGAAWSQRMPATAPWPRAGHAMVWDRARDRLVLFGGYTFVDGTVISDCPPGSDRANGMPVVPLLCHFHDTWSWDGTDWTELVSAGALPAYREGAALGYDAAGQAVILFGGEGFEVPSMDFLAWRDDTWRLDGSGWTRLVPAGALPPPRRDHSLVEHEGQGRLLLLGGNIAGASETDVWQWSGTTWREVTPRSVAPRSRNSDIVYSPASDQLLATTGRSQAGLEDDLWLLDGGGAAAEPGFLYVADLGRQGVDLARIGSVRARAVAGGLGGPFDASGSGASLYVWDNSGRGQWSLVDQNLADPALAGDDPELLWSVDGDATGAFVNQSAQRVEVLVRSRQPTGALAGSQVAEVALDWIEVSVGYTATP